jgi:hypothetical protein
MKAYYQLTTLSTVGLIIAQSSRIAIENTLSACVSTHRCVYTIDAGENVEDPHVVQHMLAIKRTRVLTYDVNQQEL